MKRDISQAEIDLAYARVKAAAMHDVARLAERFTELADLLRARDCE